MNGIILLIFTCDHVSTPFFAIAPVWLSVPLFFGSRKITNFHSPVHEGSVDVDEIDEDLKVEASLDGGFSLVATK